MKFNMTKIAAGLVLATAATGAQAVAVSSITITGGHFSMGQSYTTATCSGATTSDFGSCHAIAAGAANTLNAGDTGVAKADTAAFSPDIAHFSFFGAAQVTAGLAPSASGAQLANDWGSGFSGTTDGTTVTLNLGGFYANWNGTNFLQGTDSTGANGTSTAAVGTVTGWDGDSGNFDLEYHSYINGGAFDGQTGYWHLAGTVAAVPEASTYGMMLAGLGLVGFAVRRRKVMA